MGEKKRGRDKRCLSSSSSLSLRKRRGNKGHRDFRLTRMVDSPLINRSEETKRTGLDAVAHQSDKRSFRGKSINTSYATVSPSARDRFRSICLCPKRIRRDKPWQNTALPLPVSFPSPFFGKDFVLFIDYSEYFKEILLPQSCPWNDVYRNTCTNFQ